VHDFDVHLLNAIGRRAPGLLSQHGVPGKATRNLVAGGMCVLMENPEEQARLTVDPSLLPTAVEEMLRYVSPVTFLRTATKDTELRGVRVHS